MAPINCPKCNAPIDSRSTFCGNCGYALQTTGAATSSSSLEQQKGAFPSSTFPMAGSPPPPPPFPSGNTPSSVTFPGAGSPPPPPPYPGGNMPSSPSYQGAGSPPPYPSGNMSSSPSYSGAGTPPPYPGGSTPSSPTYQTNVPGFPPAAYPKSEPNLPSQQPQLPQPRKRKNKGGMIFAVIVAIILIGAAVGGTYFYTTHIAPQAKTSATPTHGTTATTAPTTNAATATPDLTATAAATTGTATATATATLTTGSTTPTPGTTATTVTGTTTSYSATQPGPGCDSNGGTWTPQGISKITCGTQISVSASNGRGYLSLQLPNNQAFAPNNTIGVTGALQGGSDCVGLAEQSANAGYLAEYCNDGNWHIYSISGTGAIVKTLTQSITSTRSSEQLSLSINGTSLSFSIDTEVHKISISAIQPTKVAITYLTGYYGGTVTVTNFSYTTP